MTRTPNRRSFFQVSGAAVAGAGAGALLGGPAQAAHAAQPAQADDAPRVLRKSLKLRLGTQRRASDVATLQEFKRHGVSHVVGYPPAPPLEDGRGYWLPEEVEQTRVFAEENGLQMDMVALPLLPSSLIDDEKRPAIMLGKSPERDRDIDDIHKCIEACAAAGVGAFKYNMSITGIPRTADTPGRGGSVYSTFRAADVDPNLPDTIAGKVTAESFWERIDYFIQRVIPVAHQFKIQAACHPQDPGTPPGGYRGVEENVLSQPGGKGLFEFLALHDSPYHGLNLCCGTLAEMLWEPEKEIYGIFRRLLRTKRVFNVHLRNIKGRRDDFMEVWPDEGVVDHARMLRIMAEEGYPYSVDPDHVPDHPDDPGNKQGFAHGYGYIRALIQSVESAG